MSFSEAAKICWPVLNTAQETLRRTQAPKNQSCFKGCGACCHSALISSSSLEAFGVLVAWVGSGHSLHDLAQRCQSYVQGYLSFRERTGHLPFSLAARRRFMLELLACPLFVPGTERFAGACGFFEHRPIICSSYHSLGPASGCATLAPHAVDTAYITMGTDLSESLRHFERKTFGKSALGHLPLLLAALVTQEGLNAFLSTAAPQAGEAQSQEEIDFSFLVSLYQAAGVALTLADLEDLMRAKDELLPQTPDP
jgi:hypothetical protein